MNAKSSNFKRAIYACTTLATAGCSTIPAGHTVVVENDVVVWESFGKAKLAKLAEFPVEPPMAATTIGEFPGQPIHGVWSAPEVVAQQPARDEGMTRADIAFLRELARTDGNASVEPFETPSETAVASR